MSSKLSINGAIKYIIFLSGIFLVSCASISPKVEYYQTLLPTYGFDTNAPTIVLADANDFSSNFYVGIAIKALKDRGFSNIYMLGEINSLFARNVIYVKVAKTRSSTTENYEFSFKQTGVCKIVNGVQTCSVQSQDKDSPKSKPKTFMQDTYYVTLDWYDAYNTKRILYMGAYVRIKKDKEPDLDVFTKLIHGSVARINFKKPNAYEYKY